MRGTQALLDDYAAAWSRIAAEHIIPFWNAEAFRFYKAEEIDHVFASWEATCAYWAGNEGLHRTVRLGFSDVNAAPVADGWQIVTARMRWDIRFNDLAPAAIAGKAMGGDNHVLMLLHNDRFAGWGEMPDAPVSYIRQMHMALARDV